MEPNLRAIRETGHFDDDRDLRELVASNPQALQLASAVPRIEFWRDFFGGDTRSLVVALTRSPGLLCQDVDKGISPKVALLKVYGLSQSSIASVMVRGQCLFRNSASRIESLLRKIEGFGFPRGSPMFTLALLAFCGVRSDTFKAKMELFRSFGWSEGELNSVIKKFPFIVRLSEENLRAKIPFLVQKAGCTPSYILDTQLCLASAWRRGCFLGTM
ncbi:uncharacterized protein M6B38_168285 [Iris pallida]|uniref:Uncharacterized protein n=1 Tax=Iris pallida TaxID=29817 RepID=A0AAX6EW64_IRIPA|nr:uncharacterized protein M6B38_168285 [Iris pallida]